jgi:adenylate cyclase
MEPRGGERRLAAILAADMVGYSRLMEADETGTLARLRTHRLELVDPAIAKNHGHIIKTTGDGMLVEFQSVADAVECAAEIQRRMARRNADVSPARWIQFRIGINLGDVIVEEGDIFGDGVNVAARLRSWLLRGSRFRRRARSGGDRLNVAFEDSANNASGVSPVNPHLQRLARKDSGQASEAVVKSQNGVSGGAPVNMSGDPQQEFFADGLSEDIITELSLPRPLGYLRNSAFVHKGKAVKVRTSREFGVHYVVEGAFAKPATVFESRFNDRRRDRPHPLG